MSRFEKFDFASKNDMFQKMMNLLFPGIGDKKVTTMG